MNNKSLTFPRMPAGSLFIITKSKVPDCHMIMAFGSWNSPHCFSLQLSPLKNK